MENPKNWTDRELLEGAFAMIVDLHRKVNRLETAVAEIYNNQDQKKHSNYYEGGEHLDATYENTGGNIDEFYRQVEIYINRN